jgi:hypothetical protein
MKPLGNRIPAGRVGEGDGITGPVVAGMVTVAGMTPLCPVSVGDGIKTGTGVLFRPVSTGTGTMVLSGRVQPLHTRKAQTSTRTPIERRVVISVVYTSFVYKQGYRFILVVRICP